jgi:lactoylglutathione lyase
MSDLRAFPVVYARDVSAVAAFYARLGFEEHFRLPPEGEPGYVGLRRGDAELAVTTVASPLQFFGLEVGSAPRFELYVYVEDVDAVVSALQAAGGTVLREPGDMPWGERVGYVADPEGNPVALCAAPKPASR